MALIYNHSLDVPWVRIRTTWVYIVAISDRCVTFCFEENRYDRDYFFAILTKQAIFTFFISLAF